MRRRRRCPLPVSSFNPAPCSRRSVRAAYKSSNSNNSALPGTVPRWREIRYPEDKKRPAHAPIAASVVFCNQCKGMEAGAENDAPLKFYKGENLAFCHKIRFRKLVRPCSIISPHRELLYEEHGRHRCRIADTRILVVCRARASQREPWCKDWRYQDRSSDPEQRKTAAGGRNCSADWRRAHLDRRCA